MNCENPFLISERRVAANERIPRFRVTVQSVEVQPFRGYFKQSFLVSPTSSKYSKSRILTDRTIFSCGLVYSSVRSTRIIRATDESACKKEIAKTIEHTLGIGDFHDSLSLHIVGRAPNPLLSSLV
ncbi:uncharacterized protein LOC143186595 [Calliopsis andreniformis]|uniref:uncharacterized protein LOC143186595 n=1 Tax=Calliopsis andreniformis TaxID=337506 RepID=UPI003FCD2E53